MQGCWPRHVVLSFECHFSCPWFGQDPAAELFRVGCGLESALWDLRRSGCRRWRYGVACLVFFTMDRTNVSSCAAACTSSTRSRRRRRARRMIVMEWNWHDSIRSLECIFMSIPVAVRPPHPDLSNRRFHLIKECLPKLTPEDNGKAPHRNLCFQQTRLCLTIRIEACLATPKGMGEWRGLSSRLHRRPCRYHGETRSTRFRAITSQTKQIASLVVQ